MVYFLQIFVLGVLSVIVGVATAPKYQKIGLGRVVLSRLIEELFKLYDNVYLQYEDERAKALYISMGFRKIDDVYHYEKRILWKK